MCGGAGFWWTLLEEANGINGSRIAACSAPRSRHMRAQKDRYCSYCGTRFVGPPTYPRKCPNLRCGAQAFANPIPVVLLLQPVLHEGRTGLLVVRRAILPQIGKLALIGGFLEEHETWQEGAAREAKEEASLDIHPSTLRPHGFDSTEPRPNRILLFVRGESFDAKMLPPFVPNHEVSERGIIFGTHDLLQDFAFPLHLRAAAEFFGNFPNPHNYQPL